MRALAHRHTLCQPPRRAAVSCRAAPATTVATRPVQLQNDTRALLKAVCDAQQQQQQEQQQQDQPSTTRTAAAAAEQDLLTQVYEQLDEEVFFSKGGWLIPARERALIDSISSGAATYGEVMPAGILRLLDMLSLDDSSTFCDLGSGIGRVALSAAMHSPAAGVVGLELSDSRLEQAEAAAEVLSGLGVPLRPTQFVSANLATCDLEAVAGATHYFMCSTAFGAALCRSLAERLSRCPSFQVLVTSRPLPPQPYLLKVGQIDGVEYSWIANGLAHVYVKSLASAPPAVLARFLCRDGICWAPPAGPAEGAWRRGFVFGDDLLAVAPAAGQ